MSGSPVQHNGAAQPVIWTEHNSEKKEMDNNKGLQAALKIVPKLHKNPHSLKCTQSAAPQKINKPVCNNGHARSRF